MHTYNSDDTSFRSPSESNTAVAVAVVVAAAAAAVAPCYTQTTDRNKDRIRGSEHVGLTCRPDMTPVTMALRGSRYAVSAYLRSMPYCRFLAEA